MVPTLNEGSRCFVKAKFTDKSGAAQIPSSLSYRVDCETTNTEILDWTAVTPAQTVEVQIDANLNSIVNRNNPIERKTVTFLANADPPSGAFTSTFEFDLVLLQALTT